MISPSNIHYIQEEGIHDYLYEFQKKYLSPIKGIYSAPGIKLRTQTGREDHSLYPEYKSVAGSRAELPCNVSVPDPGDAITLILWYRGNHSLTPIYTVDSREEPLFNSTHFMSNDVFSGKKVSFDLTSRPALLKLEPVLEEDSMEYRCRVDFRWGRTKTSHVFLNVIVPSRAIVIRDINGTHVQNTVIGPYNENMDVMLTCLTAYILSPPPVLHWYRNNTIINSSYKIDNNGMAVNELVIRNLTATDLRVLYICQANNFLNYSHPIRSSVSIDINLSPLSVAIITDRTVLSAGHKVEITCETKGSRPPSVIVWFKNNTQLTHLRESVSEDGNTTTSVLNLIPTVSDDNALLICRAHNPRLPHLYIEDQWELQVFYDPKVKLTIGKSPKLVTLKEGSKTMMECTIKSNPSASDIKFLLNDTVMQQNVINGIFINNNTLTISDLRPEHRGKYRCSAYNIVGTGVSDEVILDIEYTPICRNSTNKTTTELAFNETVVLRCEVDAQPQEVSFYWKLNNNELHSNHTENGMSSELTFTARSQYDFGILSCWAKNQIGLQRHPCLFTITTALPPQPLQECIVINRTMTSLTIDCIPGDSAGLKQTFFAQVFDTNYPTLSRNQTTATTALFIIDGLSSGIDYTIDLFAINAKGVSEPKRLFVTTLSTMTTKLVSGNHELEYDPLLAIMGGVLLSLVLIILIVIIICKIKRQGEGKDRQEYSLRNISTEYSDNEIQNTNNDDMNYNKNPDVIPSDRQKVCESKVNVFLINDLQTTANNPIENTLKEMPKSIILNGYIANGYQKGTEGDLRDRLLYYDQRDAGLIIHQTVHTLDDFDGNDVLQTAV